MPGRKTPVKPARKRDVLEQVARMARKTLAGLADPVKARGAERYFKETVKCYGVAAAEIHALAAELYDGVRADWTADEAIALCDILFADPELEAKAVGGARPGPLQEDVPARRSSPRPRAGSPSDLLANWASVDTLCPDSMGAFLERYPAYVGKIKAWAFHPNRWVKRAALVSFIKLARKAGVPAGGLRDLGLRLRCRRRSRPKGQRLAAPGGGQGRPGAAWSGSSWPTARPSRGRPFATPSSAFRKPSGRRFFFEQNQN